MQTTPTLSSTAAVTKSKVLAVILAVILGPYVWAYTYDKDKVKFWEGNAIQYLCVIIAFISIILIIVSETETASGDSTANIPALSAMPGLVIALLVVLLGLRIWAFIDRLAKPSSWYENYPKVPLKKTMAVIFAVFFFYIAWLYTYEKKQE